MTHIFKINCHCDHNLFDKKNVVYILKFEPQIVHLLILLINKFLGVRRLNKNKNC